MRAVYWTVRRYRGRLEASGFAPVGPVPARAAPRMWAARGRDRQRLYVVAEALLALALLAGGLGVTRLGGVGRLPTLASAERALLRWLPPAAGLPAVLGAGALGGAAAVPVQAEIVAAPAGRAILLTAGDQAVLIDGGPPAVGESIAADLRRLGITRVDAAFMTKASDGEALGLLPVLDAMPVGAVYDLAPGSGCPAGAAVLADAAARGTPVQSASSGTRVAFGPALLEVVWPPAGAASPPNGPAGGGAVRLVDGNVRLLFAGNVAPADLDALVGGSPDLGAQVLEVPAGNVATTVDPSLLRAVGPRIAVLLPGSGTPTAAVRQRLAAARVLAVEAGLEGDLRLQTDGRGITLSFDAGLPGQAAADSTTPGPGAAPRGPCA